MVHIFFRAPFLEVARMYPIININSTIINRFLPRVGKFSVVHFVPGNYIPGTWYLNTIITNKVVCVF